MARLELKSQDARLGNEQADLRGDAALPNRATDEFTERWDAARRLAAQLQSRGVDAGQVYILLNALLPSGWDSNAGICLGGDAAAWFLREMGLLGSALFTTLFMYSVVEAELSEAVDWRTATMAMVSHGQGNGQANVLNDSDCHHRARRHTGQRVGVQPATEDVQCFAEEGVAVLDEQASGSDIGNLSTRTGQSLRRLARSRGEGTFCEQETRSRAPDRPYSRSPSHIASSRSHRTNPARQRGSKAPRKFVGESWPGSASRK